MLGRESRDRTRQVPNIPVLLREGRTRPGRRASPGRLDRKAQALLPDATVMTQIFHGKTGSDRRSDDPEIVPRNRFVDGPDAANYQQSAAPDRTRPGSRDGMTAQRVGEETP